MLITAYTSLFHQPERTDGSKLHHTIASFGYRDTDGPQKPRPAALGRAV
jgi:hypothetical protein